MGANGKVVDLRNLLAERFPRTQLPNTAHLRTRLSFLDQATGGGLPKGAITELISPQVSAGSASLIYALLQAAWRDRYFLALIDGRDSSIHPAGADWAMRRCKICFGCVAEKLRKQSKRPISFCAMGIFRL